MPLYKFFCFFSRFFIYLSFLSHIYAFTCILLLIVSKNDPGTRKCFLINLGDTRAVLIDAKENTSKRISYDHKASDPKEQERIIAEGGNLMNNRVGGNLAVRRAVGDLLFKTGGEHGVSITPSVEQFEIAQGQEAFVVMASDGLWDVMDDDQVREFILPSLQKKSIYSTNNDLINKALIDLGSKDNISILIV